MYYVDLKFFSIPPRISGVTVDTQSMNTAVQRVQDWINGYCYSWDTTHDSGRTDASFTSPEIDRIARTKSRGIEYVRLEDFR